MMRKSGHKLEHGKFRLDIRKIIFTMRVIQGRNRFFQRGSICAGVQDLTGQIPEQPDLIRPALSRVLD